MDVKRGDTASSEETSTLRLNPPFHTIMSHEHNQANCIVERKGFTLILNDLTETSAPGVKSERTELAKSELGTINSSIAILITKNVPS